MEATTAPSIDQRIADKQREYEELALAALSDPSFDSLKIRLRQELRGLEDEKADAAAAQRALTVQRASLATIERRERQRQAFATVVAKCGEMEDLGAQIDATAELLWSLFTRWNTVNGAMRAEVGREGTHDPAQRIDMIHLSAFTRTPLAEAVWQARSVSHASYIRSLTIGAIRDSRRLLEIDSHTDEDAA